MDALPKEVQHRVAEYATGRLPVDGCMEVRPGRRSKVGVCAREGG